MDPGEFHAARVEDVDGTARDGMRGSGDRGGAEVHMYFAFLFPDAGRRGGTVGEGV